MPASELTGARGTRRRRLVRFLAWFSALLAAPKCLACVAGYLAVGAGIGGWAAEWCAPLRPDALEWTALGVVTGASITLLALHVQRGRT